MNWETVMKSKNQNQAKEMVNRLAKTRKEFGEAYDKFAQDIGYHYTNVWERGEINPHFRRVLVELKILALTGKTFLI